MKQYNDDSASMRTFSDGEHYNDIQELDKSANKGETNVMRQIEILRENKLLKSAIDDLYDY